MFVFWLLPVSSTGSVLNPVVLPEWELLGQGLLPEPEPEPLALEWLELQP